MNRKIADRIRQFNRQAKQLNVDGYILKGSVMSRYLKRLSGGKTIQCGPYFLWTRKIDNKTVTKALTKQQAQLIQTAINRHRKLNLQLADLCKTSEAIILAVTPCPPKRNRSQTSSI